MVENLEYNNASIIQTVKCETHSDLNNLLVDKNGFLILHINIRSLNKNFNNLSLMEKKTGCVNLYRDP